MLPYTWTTTNSQGHAICMWNMQQIKCRSSKYSQNVEPFRILTLDTFFYSLSGNSGIESQCWPVFEPPQIVKLMRFVCETCNKKKVEVQNTLKT